MKLHIDQVLGRQQQALTDCDRVNDNRDFKSPKRCRSYDLLESMVLCAFKVWQISGIYCQPRVERNLLKCKCDESEECASKKFCATGKANVSHHTFVHACPINMSEES